MLVCFQVCCGDIIAVSAVAAASAAGVAAL